MTKILFSIAAVCLTALVAKADLIYYESFPYTNGYIVPASTNLWARHSGTGNDALVRNGKLEISFSGTGGRSDDVNRRFATTNNSPYTNAQMQVFASFTLNCTNLPNAAGTYISHFMGHVGSTIFLGRVYALTGTNLCLPGTYRLGIAAAAGGVNKIFPVDLATNVDYQVVMTYDANPGGPLALSAQLWVNPLTSGDPSVISSDAVTGSALTNILVGYAFRQATPTGSQTTPAFFTVSNLAVATTFEEAATNVWSTNALPPSIIYQPQSKTNFVNDATLLSIVASGQELGSLIYQWRKDGSDITNPDGNTNVLAFPSAQTTDSGNYEVVVTSPTYGLSVTSAVAFFWVTNPPVPPTITTHPASTNVYFGQTATFTVAASGAGPFTYQWYYNNSPVGLNDPNLVITNVQTNNGTTGTYRCDVSNVFGTTPSSNAVLTATAAPVVTIGYLRTLVDPVFFLPTNTTALYTVTGTVTTWTNITTSNNVSFYMQDGTGGINVFYANYGGTNTPQAGDSVTITGPLGQFNSLLELNLTAADPAHKMITNSSGNLLPAGIVLPFSFTNSPNYGGVGNAIQLYQGAVVTFTNVYFAAAGGTFGSGANYVMTNQAGEGFMFRVDSRVGDIIGKPIPAFAWRVTGPMGFFLGTTVPDRSSGYQLVATRYADIVTTPPAVVTATVTLSGGNRLITWTAEPHASYTVLSATNVAGPYVPVASGLTFNTTAGSYTDTTPASSARFYQLVSP